MSSTNGFAYNPRSEVTDAAMGASTYSYSYDDIGNRGRATADASLSTYLANGLNQYTAVTNAGIGVDVAYDLDGNMITNGVWVYAWDAENRMVSASNTVSGIAIANAYDHLNRRVRKMVGPVTRHYVWDGWNIAAEIAVDAAAGTTNVHFYTWGLDLSGTPQGAGGVGGLLADTACNNQPATCDTYFPCYDANGNVTEYVDGTGTVCGRYGYSPFGEIAAQSGDMADSFTHRFSTKPFDAETGLAVYQLRPYSPPLGRWLNRDPIGERGGKSLIRSTDRKGNLIDDNLYEFVGNAPTMFFDPFGLYGNPVPPVVISECGKADVTAGLQQVLSSIESSYNRWDYCTKKAHCKALYTIPEAANAWDISPLAGIGLISAWPYPQLAKGTGKGCENTVALGGKCYHAGAVNYAMWGKVNSLCHGTFGNNPLHTLGGSKTLVFVWKTKYLWAQVGEAMDFTTYGYSGGGAPSCNLPGCVVSGTSPVGGFTFTWNQVSNP